MKSNIKESLVEEFVNQITSFTGNTHAFNHCSNTFPGGVPRYLVCVMAILENTKKEIKSLAEIEESLVSSGDMLIKTMPADFMNSCHYETPIMTVSILLVKLLSQLKVRVMPTDEFKICDEQPVFANNVQEQLFYQS